MKRTEVKHEVISSIGSLLTDFQDGKFTRSADFGSFYCSVENFDNFTIAHRNFEVASDPMDIPFSCQNPGVQMIFSLDGRSVFKDRFSPLILSPVSHSLNLFEYYECSNLLQRNAHQHDVTFCLKKSFYTDLLTSYLSSSDDRLPAMILQQKEFNTINQHVPADAGILGILKNIIDCPFKGEMRTTFIREHLRALLTLQLFHFSPIVAGKKSKADRKISKRDVEILQELKTYIGEHFLDPASVGSLAKQFGINEFKLKHGFRLLFNTSPIRYLQYKRLEYSLFLLRETDMDIKHIADEIGYSHAGNFTVAFAKTFGNSPQHYRTGGHEMYIKQLVDEKC